MITACRVLLFSLAGLGLTACIMTNIAARNDFSQMGNDFLSRLIMDADTGRGGTLGFTGINQEQVKQRAHEFFLGKKETEVLVVFTQYGDGCKFLNSNPEKKLMCEASRRWKMKAIRPPFPDYDDPSWPVPGAKLLFKFFLSPSKEVTKLETEVTDSTVYKETY